MSTDHGLQAVHGPQLTYLNFKTYFLSALVIKRIMREKILKSGFDDPKLFLNQEEAEAICFANIPIPSMKVLGR